VTNEENIVVISQYQATLASGDVREGRRLAELIVTGNEGLVVKFALKYARAQNEEDKEDALQAGRMGVLRAARDFDPKLGSFSTHAHNHIRDFVQRWSGKTVAVTRPRSASMPASVARAAQRWRQTHGSEPSAADLRVTEAQWIEWTSGTHFVEIDAGTSGDDDKPPAVQLTYDTEEADHTARCIKVEAAWKDAMQELSPRNQEIAERVFIRGESATSVAASFALTHGRVVQICKRIEVRMKRAIDPASYDPREDYDAIMRERVQAWEKANPARRREKNRRARDKKRAA
jgi:RNA polymerase sigma factor (sigma-70 family)